ncbi:hypothetical protein [Allohahella sp. A8]|uniref:hypothetical protein n=1 Tax=Allohahella sp. A8 TaxID=3141461 RepID=UPI003A806879
MLKRLATSIMQALVFAALILTGFSVQASQVMPLEDVQLQEQIVDVSANSKMNDMTSASGMAMDDDCSLADGDMNMQNCLSACGGCPAVTASILPALTPSSAVISGNLPLTAVAAHYPIDHPPKQ